MPDPPISFGYPTPPKAFTGLWAWEGRSGLYFSSQGSFGGIYGRYSGVSFPKNLPKGKIYCSWEGISFGTRMESLSGLTLARILRTDRQPTKLQRFWSLISIKCSDLEDHSSGSITSIPASSNASRIWSKSSGFFGEFCKASETWAKLRCPWLRPKSNKNLTADSTFRILSPPTGTGERREQQVVPYQSNFRNIPGLGTIRASKI